MENLIRLAFEAHSEELNRHRRYEIDIGRDLLDDWTVAIRYGRVGVRGNVQRFAARDATDVKRLVNERLRRRLTAKARIGCAYRLVMLETAPRFDAAAWLPRDLMAKFL